MCRCNAVTGLCGLTNTACIDTNFKKRNEEIMEELLYKSTTSIWKTTLVNILYIAIPIALLKTSPPKPIDDGLRIIGLIGMIKLVYGWVLIDTQVELTNMRLFIQKKFFITTNIDLDLNKIEYTKLIQSFPGGIMNYGTLLVRTSSGSNIKIKNIDSPALLYHHLMELKLKHK